MSSVECERPGNLDVVVDADVRKPLRDARKYRSCRLENGVRVLLVEDTEAVFAAACANVGVGYFDDPDDLPGLAHFVEHGVHLGSRDYPDGGEYKRFLAENGGKSNASTGTVHTMYHFEVHSDALSEALRRLSRFFVDPLLLSESLEREVSNVHSEFRRNLNSDARKSLQLLRSVGPYPLSKFSTGNQDTLVHSPETRGVDTAAVLREWWQDRYTSERVTLAVVSPTSLDSLERFCREAFSDVPRERGSSESFKPSGACLKDYRFGGSLYEIAPIRDIRGIELVWFIPHSRMWAMRSKPWFWVGHLVENEGEGSASLYLKRKGWVTELSFHMADEVRRDAGFMFCQCHAKLTETGLANVEDIIRVIYESIEMVKRMPDKAREDSFAELKNITEIKFDYKGREGPTAYASRLATNLHYFDVPEILSLPSLLEKYDGEALDRFLSYLTPENMNIYFASRHFEGTTDLKEKWYEAKYSVKPIPEDIKKAIQDAQDSAAGLELPKPNWAIPSDFLMRLAGEGKPFEWMDPPKKIIDLRTVRFWHKKDVSFRVPKISVRLHLISAYTNESALHSVRADLFALIVNDILDPILHPAVLAGISFSASVAGTGLMLRFDGFGEIVPKVIRLVCEKISSLSREEIENRFPPLHDRLSESLRNRDFMNPHLQANYSMNDCLSQPSWHTHDKLEECQNLTLEDIFNFWEEFRAEMTVEGLALGNLEDTEAADICFNIVSLLKPSGLPAERWRQKRVCKITSISPETQSLGSCVTYKPRNPNPENGDSAVYVLYQIGLDDFGTMAHGALFQLISEKNCFHQLRTVEKLGYIVKLELHRLVNVVGVGIRVQTAGCTPDELDKRVQAWLHDFRKDLEGLSDAEFNSYKNSLSERKMEPPKTLPKAMDRFWEMIKTRRYRFDATSSFLAELNSITKKTILEFYDRHLARGAAEEKRLCTQIWGSEAIGKGGFTERKSFDVPGNLKSVWGMWPDPIVHHD
ncbi:hypothetical protein BSKO_07704 [Bryopsis sp. KO-2023]|nr:hypothetical protein BSKO_07704 [Bryopsis sp. KO-2023]